MPTEQAVFRIDCGQLRLWSCREPVGTAQHHLTDKCFHGTPTCAKPLGQMLQKFWMSRGLPLDAKIVHRPHNAPTEELRPEAVHHHPVQQTVLGSGDPVGQLQPAAGTGGNDGRRPGVQYLREVPRHQRSALRHFPADAEVAVARILGIAGCHGQLRVFEFVDLLRQRLGQLSGRHLEDGIRPPSAHRQHFRLPGNVLHGHKLHRVHHHIAAGAPVAEDHVGTGPFLELKPSHGLEQSGHGGLLRLVKDDFMNPIARFHRDRHRLAAVSTRL